MDYNFGSGSALLGGNAGATIEQQLMQRQQGNAGATSQQTPASPGFDPNTQQPSPATQPSMPSSQGTVTTPKGLPPGDPDATMIVKALIKRING